MGKKMKLPHFLSTKHHPWLQWPSYSCNHNPKTLSYRFDSDDVFRTVNSVFFDPNDAVDTPESWFTNSSESASFSGATTESDDFPDGESLETLVAGARSERRLFVEPGGDTSSILAEKSSSGNFSCAGVLAGDGEFSRPLRESVILAMESDDPYRDFRRSMEEMVEINGVKEWEGLEEMLGWYLRVNGKENHGFIVGAFMDLLVELANNSGRTDDCDDVHSAATTTTITTATDSFSSAVSCFPDHEPLITCSCSRRHEEERNLTR